MAAILIFFIISSLKLYFGLSCNFVEDSPCQTMQSSPNLVKIRYKINHKKLKRLKIIIQEVNGRQYFLIHFLLENLTNSCRFQLNRMSNNLYPDQSLW